MSKLFNEDDVFSWANRKEAEVYIGKEGYLANSLETFEELIRKKRTYTRGKRGFWSFLAC